MNRRDFVKKTSVVGTAIAAGLHSRPRTAKAKVVLPATRGPVGLDDFLATVAAISNRKERAAAERRLAGVYGVQPSAEAAKTIKSSIANITIDGPGAYPIIGSDRDEFVSLMLDGTVLAQHAPRHTVKEGCKAVHFPFYTVELHSFTALFSDSDQGGTPKGRQRGPFAASHTGWSLDHAILLGSGVGQPEGIRNCNAAIHVARERSGHVTKNDVMRMLDELLPPAMPRCRWLAARSLVGRLPGRLYDRKSGELVGRPVEFTEHLASIGDGAAIMLVDPIGYQVVASDTIYVAPARKADGQVFLALCYAIGGTPRIREPFGLTNGSSFSHFVLLD